MTIEKKMIRSDIPGHQVYLNGGNTPGADAGEETRRLVVTRDIAVMGKISACDHLVVEGTVQAESFCARRLDIMGPGLFIGVAEVDTAVISGCFEGRLLVLGKLTIKSTGRICGDIEYGALEMEAGARIDGRIAALAPPVVDETFVDEVAAPMSGEQLFETSNEDNETEEEIYQPQNFRRASGY